MLNYYRNGLVHVFIIEAICICCLYSFGVDKNNLGVDIDLYIKEVIFLFKLLDKEYVQKEDLTTYENCMNYLKILQSRD